MRLTVKPAAFRFFCQATILALHALDFGLFILYLADVKQAGMEWYKNIFNRKVKQDPQPLRVEGIPNAPITAEPDEAELAAQALFESVMQGKNTRKEENNAEPENGTPEYYQRLAEKIRAAHDAATLRTMRFVAFCEKELQQPDLPVSGHGSLELLEAELYKRIDTIERDGGELKRRWQHCLAEVTVRIMQATDERDNTDNH